MGVLRKGLRVAEKGLNRLGSTSSRKKMTTRDRLAMAVMLFLAAVIVITLIVYGNNFAVLNPKGLIATKERGLIIYASLLMLIIVVPVYIMTFSIAWRYRATNEKAKYTPDWDHNRLAETAWWLIPSLLILVLSVVAWQSSHELDPFHSLSTKTKPMTIQVVALQWKWLFIYPEQNIATVNYVEFPANTPVNFEITSDAPMNSFWIPQLGGQIYAMTGMSTQLHLIASEIGSYRGVSANISGEGFAGMKFTARVGTETEFRQWVQTIKMMPSQLDSNGYNILAEPSLNNPVIAYGNTQTGLYSSVVNKFMDPSSHEPVNLHNHEHTDYGANQ